MAVTIRDVASAAGVSPMAVSKVLHGKGKTVRVSAEKAEEIRKVARSLHYQKNQLAASFRTKRTEMIAIVFESFRRLGGNTGYFVQLVDGVAAAAFERGYSLTICPKMVNFSENGISYDGRFDGLIWCKPDHDPVTLSAMSNSKMPIVALHAPNHPNVTVPQYCCDNDMGIRLAIEHLVSLGHRRISYVVDKANATSDEAFERKTAFLKYTKQLGCNVTDENVHVWSAEAEEFKEAWKAHQMGTAIVGFGEGQAGEILNRALEIGVRVPSELSVIGFDSTPYCETLSPKLSSIFQPIEEMAHFAATRLLDIIDVFHDDKTLPKVAELHRYPCRIDLRESTGIASDK